MTLLGLDFDNTLVSYDELFHKLALEKGLIDRSLPAKKVIIRQHLIEKGKGDEFTLLQGEAYGPRILEAPEAEGMTEALRTMSERKIKMILISHKTVTPYKGPAYKLRDAAIGWLETKGFFDELGLSWSKDNIYFESTLEEKIDRIRKEKCDYFIDDLPKVIDKLPKGTSGIHYCPDNTGKSSQNTMRHWNQANQMIKKNE